MGMFDRIHFTCPRCDAGIEAQSKHGECTLADISSNAVPIAIAADIVGEEVWCNECMRTWTIVSIDPPPVVVMRLA